MRRIVVIGLALLALTLSLTASALAAPGDTPGSASCVAHCATTMGGQHVANCAQTSENGVSVHAMMSESECGHTGASVTM